MQHQLWSFVLPRLISCLCSPTISLQTLMGTSVGLGLRIGRLATMFHQEAPGQCTLNKVLSNILSSLV